MFDKQYRFTGSHAEKVNALRKDLGDDVLLQMVEEILNAS